MNAKGLVLFSRFISMILIFYSFLSCNKDDMFLPDLKGSLVGYVCTFDEFGNLLQDHSGVTITAFGHKHYGTTTDLAGRFEIKGLPAGTYELQIEKTGFGTMKQFGIKHLGGQPTILGLNPNNDYPSTAYFIYKMPTTQILDMHIENDTIYGSFSFTSQQPNSLDLILYFSTKKDFTVSDAEDFALRSLENSNGQYRGKLFAKGFIHFQPGDVVFTRGFIHAKAYSVQIYEGFELEGIDTYYDFDSNQTVYPNSGDESEQFSFVF
jgi:hypothetical protein